MSVEITISLDEAARRYRCLVDQQRELAADFKELATICRASKINAALLKKWVKAEAEDDDNEKGRKVEKLVEQTREQAMYGDALGHQIGIGPVSPKNVCEPHDPATGEVYSGDPLSVSSVFMTGPIPYDRNKELAETVAGMQALRGPVA